MLTHKLTRGWQEGSASLSSTITVTSGAETNIDIAVANPSTNTPVELTMKIAQLKSLYMVSDQPITIYTNAASTGAPANTFSIAANAPFSWALANDPPLRDTTGAAVTVDITHLYITNTVGGATANLSIRALFDPAV